jgi:16S rRNA (cytidine1402-2'-O)-methyltransferase
MLHEANPVERPALYVVATPIGNLGDISLRARSILCGVDCIAAEDTRVTAPLLRHLGSRVPLVGLREHNEREAAAQIIARLESGQAVAQVSDAGTPAVSDPGARLVAAVHAAGFRVIPVPGASAVLAALAAAGMASPRFSFHGFPEPKHSARLKEFSALAHWPHSLVFFEAPHRIEESLADMAATFGAQRTAVFARELSKTFETIRRDTLGALSTWVASDPNQRRGEIVLVVEAAPDAAPDDSHAALDTLLRPLMRELPLKQAVALAVELGGQPRNTVYARALALQQAQRPEDPA